MSGHLVARTLFDARAALGGAPGPITVGFAEDGSVIAVLPRGLPAGEDQAPHVRWDRPVEYDVVRWRAGDCVRTRLRPHHQVAHHVAGTASGVLLVAARCPWRGGGGEANATEFAWTGEPRRRLVLGDGISDLRTTSAGIWVAYFDEGVFGNYGWNSPGPEPIGASGLVEFAPDGAIRSRFDPAAAGTDIICDAYAMNVTDAEAWAYFYTDFPIVRIRGGEYRSWSYGTGGARAIAARDTRVLLYGGYRDDECRIVDLRWDGTTRLVESSTVRAADGSPVQATVARGVGPALYLLAGDEVLTVDEW